MATKEKREAYRKKYTTQYKEQVKRELESGYLEMGDLNLELAEEGIRSEK